MRTRVARGLRLDVAFADAAPGLEPRDRAFLQELLFGTSRLQGRLDHLLSRRVKGGLERLDPPVLEALRLGAYELLYMGGVPDYAARSQAVELATEAAGRGAGGLVNAVLRRVAEDGDGPERFPDPEADPAGFLSTWGSHPRWLVERWLGRWSFEEVRALVEADNAVPDLHLVPLDREPGEAVAALAAAGIEAEPVEPGRCLRLERGTDPVAALDVLPSIVQDPGANLVVAYADPPADGRLIDVCAAPGGKALALSRRASYTSAADRSGVRMGLVRQNVDRTGSRVGMVVADATRPPFRPVEAVLVDAPCTGTGTLRRHPDGRWRLSPGDPGRLAELQRAILRAVAPLVLPGGVLVYSTCTLEPEENERQIETFLTEHPEFSMEPTSAVPEPYVDGRGFLRVLPQRSGFDGAFAARLRRRS